MIERPIVAAAKAMCISAITRTDCRSQYDVTTEMKRAATGRNWERDLVAFQMKRKKKKTSMYTVHEHVYT
jgi:hypothetical protein